MAALQWANEVLELPSCSSAIGIRESDLPASPELLANAWCESLRSSDASQETHKVVLKALRVSRLLESHDLIIGGVTPLLLSTSPSIRLQAAGALLQYTSICSSPILQSKHAAIVSSIKRTLTPIRLTIASNSSSSSTSRFVSTCFRILTTIVSKIRPLSSDIVDTVVSLLVQWVYYGPSNTGTSSPAPARSRTTNDASQLSFGVMSAFSQISVSPRKRTATSRAPSQDRESASESESEDSREDRRIESAQVRLDASICLRALAKNNNRELQKHWHHFLSDSPYLRNRSTLLTLVENDPSREVRLQACQALEALLEDSATYLSIAQDRPTKASFTSLSSKVGETVGELHLTLIPLLHQSVTNHQIDLRLAILDLAKVLATNSPYGRMKRPLAGPLAKALTSSLSSQEPTVVERALTALTAIVCRCVSTSSSQAIDLEELIDKVEHFLEKELDEQTEIALWRFLASTVSSRGQRDWSFALSHLSRGFEQVSSALQASRVEFLGSFFPQQAETLPPISLPTVVPLVIVALSSQHSTSRAIACSTLSHPYLNDHQDLQPLQWATRLSRDRDSEVAQAAHRVLGLLLRDSDNSSEEHREAVEMLMYSFREDTDPDICWAFANACDGLKESNASDFDIQLVVDRCLILILDSRSDEAIQISCLRIFGAMLRLLSTMYGPQDDCFSEIISTFEEVLASSKSAQVRWNVCTSLNRALPNLSPAIVDTYAFSALLDRLVEVVTSDPSYKVRLHSVSLLTSVSAISKPRDSEFDRGKVKATAERAKSDLREQSNQGKVQAKERRHVEVLLKKLDALLTLVSS